MCARARTKRARSSAPGHLLGAHHEWPQEALRIGEVQDRNPAALNRAKADRDGGLVYGADGLKVEDHLRRWLEDSVRGMMRGTTFERYEQICRKHVVPTLGRVKRSRISPPPTCAASTKRSCETSLCARFATSTLRFTGLSTRPYWTACCPATSPKPSSRHRSTDRR